jgi:hypothetical protein
LHRRAALKDRAPGITHAGAVVQVLIDAMGEQEAGAGIEGFHRGYGGSEALRSRMLRMWAEYEDKVTVCLATEAGTPPTPAMRLHAVQLIGIVRSVTAPEVRALVAGLDPAAAGAALKDWLRSAAGLTGAF